MCVCVLWRLDMPMQAHDIQCDVGMYVCMYVCMYVHCVDESACKYVCVQAHMVSPESRRDTVY